MVMEKLSVHGYEVCLLPDTKCKTASFIVYICIPLQQQTASYFSVLPAVLARGCAAFPETEAFHTYLETLMGATFTFSVTKRGAEQVLALRFKTVADRFARGSAPFSKLVELAGDVLFRPLIENDGFRPAYTQREKENLKQYIAGITNDKRKYAKYRLIEEMCAGEEYSVSAYGTPQEVDKITPQTLLQHYRKCMQKAKISFYVTDHFSKETVLPLLEQMLKDRPAAAYPACVPVIKQAPLSPRTFTETAPVTQGKLSIGFRTLVTRSHPLFYAMMIVNSLFGGAPYSKLFTHVREKLSLAYYASSEYVSLKGLILVNSGIEFENFELAKQEILVQLQELQNGHFTDEEMDFAKLDIADSLTGVQDNGEMLSEFYAALSAAGVADTPASVIQKVRAVSRQDIIDAASSICPDMIYFLKGEE